MSIRTLLAALPLAALLALPSAPAAHATSNDECISPEVENSDHLYCYYTCYSVTDSSSQKCRDKSGLDYDIPTGMPVPNSWPAHSTNTNDMFIGGTGVHLFFTLPDTYQLKGFHYWNFNQVKASHGIGPNGGCRYVTVYVAEDSLHGEYHAVGGFLLKRASGAATYTGDSALFALPQTAKFVEFEFDTSWGDRGAGLAEVRFIGQRTGTVAGVGAPTTHTGTLLAIAPNPVRGSTQLLYSLRQDADVTLDVLDVEGRAVAHLAQGHQTAGLHAVTWETRNALGAEPPAGMYFARLHAGEVVSTKRITLVR